MLNKFFTNLLIFGLSLNIALYLLSVYQIVPSISSPFMDLSTWSGWFNLDALTLLFTGTATIIGVAALLLRQGTYAIYALLLAALTMIIRPVQQFVTAIPNAILSWIPESANPIPGGPNPIFIVVSLLFVFAAFWFILSLVIQRDIS